MTKENTKSVIGIARARLNSRPSRPFTSGADGAKPRADCPKIVKAM